MTRTFGSCPPVRRWEHSLFPMKISPNWLPTADSRSSFQYPQSERLFAIGFSFSCGLQPLGRQICLIRDSKQTSDSSKQSEVSLSDLTFALSAAASTARSSSGELCFFAPLGPHPAHSAARFDQRQNVLMTTAPAVAPAGDARQGACNVPAVAGARACMNVRFSLPFIRADTSRQLPVGRH